MIEITTQDADVELMNGPPGLPGAMSVMLDVPITVGRRLADTLHAARLDTDLQTLRVLGPARMRLPIPSRRIDFLA